MPDYVSYTRFEKAIFTLMVSYLIGLIGMIVCAECGAREAAEKFTVLGIVSSLAMLATTFVFVLPHIKDFCSWEEAQ